MRSIFLVLALASLALIGIGEIAFASGGSCVEGIVWQPDNLTINPHGDWHELGVNTLLVQWTAVDGKAFVHGSSLSPYEQTPDWHRIAKAPWAQYVILGLAGAFSEAAARNDMAKLAHLSARLTNVPTPLNVKGYYFPVEADPTWANVYELPKILALLPRPLWISVYDGSNLGPSNFTDWLASWLPRDINVLFQDGVGAHNRDPSVAAAYADSLVKRFGKEHIAVISEAFRPAIGSGFRAATAEELKTQIAAEHGHRLFLFDGPHYVSNTLVKHLVTTADIGPATSCQP